MKTSLNPDSANNESVHKITTKRQIFMGFVFVLSDQEDLLMIKRRLMSMSLGESCVLPSGPYITQVRGSCHQTHLQLFGVGCRQACPTLQFVFVTYEQGADTGSKEFGDQKHALGWFAAIYEATGWESAPPSLQSWFSAGKWWITPSMLGLSCCPSARV